MPTRSDRPDYPELCFVCGLDCVEVGVGYPWGPSGLNPSYDFCSCCGVEFGYADYSLEACRTSRIRWITEGAAWNEPSLKPDGWSSDEPLLGVPQRAR